MTDVFLVTATSHQALFKAFELISHDCGRQAGHINYAVPLVYQDKIQSFEDKLAYLWMNADSDFECLCTGDWDERGRIVKDYKLEEVDELLQRFFEEFC